MRIAIDTNVLVRGLVVDDAKQSEAAANFLVSGNAFVPITVMLEAEWVLRGVFNISRKEVSRLLNLILDFPAIEVERREVVEQAVECHAKGLDFADALHLFSAPHCDELVTFDNRFQRRAKKVQTRIPVRVLAKAKKKESSK